MSTVAPRPPLAEPAPRSLRTPLGAPRLAPDPTVPAPLGRSIAFALLALFGGLHWMALLQPAEPGRAFAALLVACLAIAGLLAGGRLHGWRRPVMALGVAVVALGLATLAGGVSARLLRPSDWGELYAGITRGIEALPGVRVPYRGVEPWIRIVMPLGGTVLMTLAALLAFWPRQDRLGRPFAALIALVVLYVVPAVALIFTVEFLRGAVLAVLVVAFLRVDKLKVRDARLAGVVAAAVAFGGLLVAPALDGNTPWWDYESWALDASSAKTTTYSWDHRYGPLNWPRDGREMLRVRAKRPAYWKAENLDYFDGLYWKHVDVRRDPFTDGRPDNPDAIRTWTQTIQVNVRNLRSAQVIAGGFATSVKSPALPVRPLADGTFLADRPLQRGDAYQATIYSPQPTEDQRRDAPVTDGVPMVQELALMLPLHGPLRPGGNGLATTQQPGVDLVRVDFPRWGTTGVQPVAEIAGAPEGSGMVARAVLTKGPYAGVWRLAQRLRRGARTQEDYVEHVLDYLRTGFSYTESPPLAARNLAGFLLDAKAGYCQQFSGAMALLLRMEGVPARVASGFTSGAQDTRTREYVVRDLDAHSWVEVWYPTYGWVTFDPTPSAAPARSQPDEAGGRAGVGRPLGRPNLPGDRLSGRPDALTPVESGPPWWAIALGALAALLVLAWGVRRFRRRGRPAPPLDELERALRRARREPRPGTTLRALEASFAHTPAAAGYVRALRDARYGGRSGAPTASQRRGLRSELARGGGLAGRVRAWWALPPGR
jgi:protein-glutamine gamma-glutamyltransferase